MQEIARPSADADLLFQAQQYLTHREKGLPTDPAQKAAWEAFYALYACKIRNFAFRCGAVEEEIGDCVQEVWRELLVRLPMFRLDTNRGQFDTWIFAIVQGKTANLHRSRKRRLFQGNADALPTARDRRPSPGQALEEKEIVSLAWDRLKQRLSECNLQILQLRLVEQRPVAEVAKQLGLSHEQVWYRYHRARRELEDIGMHLARSRGLSPSVEPSPQEKK